MPAQSLSKMNFALSHEKTNNLRVVPTKKSELASKLLLSNRFSLLGNMLIPTGACGSCGKRK
tara:strand:+ start:231 stop:416 length:186 start_codon:yes stop_codon:yes gene_type:complete